MHNLSDTQAILLLHAAQDQNGSMYPLPKSFSGPTGGADEPIATLLKHGLIELRETTDRKAVYRTDGDIRFGLFITDSGLAALNISDEGGSEIKIAAAPAPTRARSSKSELVKSLLEQPDGASLAQLIEATGWLPHSARAALTGLRKKGLSIERFSRDGSTCYRSVSAA